MEKKRADVGRVNVVLQSRFQELGAELAPDGIPLHFGDPQAEYQAALNTAAIFDRSHEGRLELRGPDGIEVLNRMSTNDLAGLMPGQARPTIFTNANARILDRVIVVGRAPEQLLVLAGPGRGAAVQNHLKRNIFFNDQVLTADLSTGLTQFALHGPKADEVVSRYKSFDSFGQDAGTAELQIVSVTCLAIQLKPFSHYHWTLLVPVEAAADVWGRLLDDGQQVGLRASGGLVYNALRIRAGVPGVGTELIPEYLPLELGLWDEVSFSKGCYTGQEIIARMESRQQLARTMVSLRLREPLERQTPLLKDGKTVGQVTSSVVAPDRSLHAIAVVKVGASAPGTILHSSHGEVVVGERLGVQAPFLDD